MNIKNTLSLALVAATCGACLPAHAGEVYGGIGLTGATLGGGGSFGPLFGLRAEASGGLKVNRDGKREGLDYTGEAKTSRAALFADLYPLAGVFRITAGLTANDMKIRLDGHGTNGTINGKPVNLTGETFRVDVKYARSTPFLGFGWGHNPGQGLGFFFDVGAQFGKFETTATTTIVGKFGITQADVDAEVQKVRDTVADYKVLPSLALGLTYRF